MTAQRGTLLINTYLIEMAATFPSRGNKLKSLRHKMSILKLIPQNLLPENLEKLKSLAYLIHHFHEAVEDLIRVVANYCENNVTDSAQLHRLIVNPKANETANERKTAG